MSLVVKQKQRLYLLGICIFLVGCDFSTAVENLKPSTTQEDYALSDQRIKQAFDQAESDLQVESSGKVIKVLKDDNEGSRHQRFILRLSNGHTVLISHNIDLAPRVRNLKEGDQVSFYGEYEWNNKGGVIHWTHKDPRGYHPHGWIKHQGITYN